MRHRIIMHLLVMHSIFARFSIENIMKIHKLQIDGTSGLTINPDGPLTPLRGYIGYRNGYVYNKRFFSAEIETSYSMTQKRVFRQGTVDYEFTRKPVDDGVYRDLAEKTPTDKYLSAYHSMLIKMFPSADGNLSIEAGRPNALTNFLRAEHVRKDTKYIFAALLLLSEGVDVKIAVDSKGEKNRLVIKSKKCAEKVFVDVEMHIAGIDPFTKEHKKDIYQSEVTGIVNFFLQCRDKPFLKKGGEFAEPASIEEFESGRFLNSIGFLIQAYIYEFIDTVQAYKEFVHAVHELLVDQMTTESSSGKRKDKKGRVFDRFFLQRDSTGAEMKYIKPFYELAEIMDKDMTFPFCDSSQLPVYTKIPRYKLDRTGFEEDESLKYSNCVESALLGLFCCLAYNPETGEYQTSHMGDKISDELREFFKSYPVPVEVVDHEMHMQWSRVVSCLENDKIDYKESKNELRSGAANIFLAIAEITGQSKHIFKLIDYIESLSMYESLEQNQKEYITDKIQLIITSLSHNKNVVVRCDKIELGKKSSEKEDLFCEIIAIYEFGNKEHGISIYIKSRHASLNVFSLSSAPARIKKKYEEIREICSNINTYMGCMIGQYINRKIQNMNYSEYKYTENHMENSIQRILDSGYANISKIFLQGRLTDIECKSFIIKHFIIYSADKKLGLDDPAIRITANILGSVPLNDPATRNSMILSFYFHPTWQTYYPKLGFAQSEHFQKGQLSELELFDVYEYILEQKSARLAVDSLIRYIKLETNNYNMFFSLSEYDVSKMLFNIIVEEEKISCFTELRSVFEAYMRPTEEEYVNFIYTTWFIFACEMFPFPLELTKMLYSFIDCYNLHDRSNKLKNYNNCINMALCALEEEKSLFCPEGSDTCMDNYNKLVEFLNNAIDK